MPNNVVLVLLSAYNGEKYIAEQLDSVMSQKGVDVYLMIRDDGSSDNTDEIIRCYEKRYPRKIFYYRGKNIGCCESYRWLMSKAIDGYTGVNIQPDWFAFCDQDDIWEEDKLNIAVNSLSDADNSVPNLFFSSFQKIDSRGYEIQTVKKKFRLSFGEALIMNPSVGCTQVFNRSLLCMAIRFFPNSLILHDWWIYSVCLALSGNVIYEEKPLVRYRQHEANVIGSKEMTKFRKLRNWLCHKNNNLCMNLAESLYNGYKDELKPENLSLVKMCISYKTNLFKRLMLILSCKKFSTFNFDTNLGFILSVVCGKF